MLIHLSSSTLIMPPAYALGTVDAIPATSAIAAPAAQNIFHRRFSINLHGASLPCPVMIPLLTRLRLSHLDDVVAAHAIVRTLQSLAVHSTSHYPPPSGESVGG